MARHLRPAEELLLPAVREAVAATKPANEDLGTVRLALSYARAIDTAASIAAELDTFPAIDDEDALLRLSKLAAKVHEQTVLSDLGPKLLVTLDALGATPKARAAQRGGVVSGGGKLAALRAARRPA